MQLRDYQLTGIDWLREHKRGMLLDEPGLGKTAQAIMASNFPVLVACPSYLIDQWEREINTLRPNDSVCKCQGVRDKRQISLDSSCDWTIINIQMLRTYEFPRPYQTFIIDESHHVRGHSAKQSIKARALAKKIPSVFLLTATPIKRECDDLFMQLSILDQKNFGSYYTFLAQYCKTVDTGFGSKVVGARDPGMVKALLSRYALRRTYKSTGLQLPDTITQDVIIQPSSVWRHVYRQLKDKYRLLDVTFDSAPELMRTLRALTFDLKTVAAQRIYEDNPNTIFYVYYRQSAQELGKLLDIPAIDGSMLPHDRERTAKQGGSIVATISSLSEGIDLSHLSTICYVETSYIPGDRVQATARLVRWNENIRPVRIFDIMVKGTIDTTIEKVITRREGDQIAILKQELEND
jgi:SNF2 family DNA or RNA helicase